MSRISNTFERLRQNGRKGFIPFLTVGDPDLATSLDVVLRLAELGADVIELGVPFSDPMADGPVIQRSSQRALNGGTTLNDVLQLALDFRKRSEVPIVLFTYFNPILRIGLDHFRSSAVDAGIDGLLITDVIDKEAEVISDKLAERDIDLISLIAPTTDEQRLKRICRNARGFIYAVSRAGVTGAQGAISRDAETLVGRALQHTEMPVAVGFGISTRQQITDVWKYADAAVVGSAIVTEIEKADAPNDVIGKVERFVSNLLPQQPGLNSNI